LFCFFWFVFYQFGLGGGSKASFTPFVDPRVYQTSPTDDNDESSAAGKYTNHKQTHLNTICNNERKNIGNLDSAIFWIKWALK